jgi:hypothetical protein
MFDILLPSHQHHGGECYRQHCADQLADAVVHIVSSGSTDKGLRCRSPLLCLIVVVDYGLAAIAVSIFLLDHGLAVTRLPLLDDSTVTVSVTITIVRLANGYASADRTDANTNIIRQRGSRDSDNHRGSK